MNKIICKKCGQEIDASSGECPNCGAIYYIIPEDNATKAVNLADIKKTIPVITLPDDETKAVPNIAEKPPVPKKKPAPTPVQSKKPVSRQWIFAVAASAIFALLTLIMCVMGGVFDFKKDITMPDVRGLAQNVAVNELKAHGVSANITYAESDEQEGTVIEQMPSDGVPIDKKTSIILTVSMGTAQQTPSVDTSIVVPDVMGKSYNDAQKQLEAMGLTVVVIQTEHSASVAENGVTRQSPLAGSNVTEGATISLTLSLGKPPKEYRITLSVSNGGSIIPDSTETVAEGDSLLITATADDGYELKELRINGENIGAVASYVIEDIDQNYSVYAVFSKISEPEETPEINPDNTPEPTESVRPSSATDIN